MNAMQDPANSLHLLSGGAAQGLVTEILFTPGVKLVSVLPTEFELATVYTAAICAKAQRPDDAMCLINLLVSAEHAALRRTSGFE